MRLPDKDDDDDDGEPVRNICPIVLPLINNLILNFRDHLGNLVHREDQ